MVSRYATSMEAMELPRSPINFDDYPIKAFLDANIILECRPLADLPWHELSVDGPIVAIITPTTMKEIDKKKHDGRIGKRAREFNRSISLVATGGEPVIVREAGPRVVLALSRSPRIPWELYNDLDQGDGDSCFIADVLHARDISTKGKVVVSHDIKPLAFATNYDVSTAHVPDAWLRQVESGPAEREVQRLKQQVADYRMAEPALDVAIDVLDDVPLSVIRVGRIADRDRDAIRKQIYERNPRTAQPGSHFAISVLYDRTYDDRYNAYRTRVDDYIANYERQLEHLFNQRRIAIRVSNIGNLQAENLLLEASISSGWIHDRYFLFPLGGPAAPEIRSSPFVGMRTINDMVEPRVGRHEVAFRVKPDRKSLFSVTCEDFRHGQEWQFSGIVLVDPAASQSAEIVVTVTSSNLRGAVIARRTVATTINNIAASDLVDFSTLKLKTPPFPKGTRKQDLDDQLLRGAD
jgi:hypothetical protein